MHVHANATTTPKQRQAIRSSPDSCRQLARRCHVSPATVHRWKHRDDPTDRSCRPKRIRYALSPEEEALVLGLRAHGLSLDETFEACASVLPHACRSTVYRTLRRHGRHRLQAPEERKAGTFKEYPPGYLHIDHFSLPQLEGVKRYCFLAVDRATRLMYLEVYAHKDAASATDFLGKCLAFFPFTITHILTDNGREFTLEGFRNR
jgi:hypothetical protein